MANKMGNKLIALCTVALGAAYTTGYVMTKSPSTQVLAAPSGTTNVTTSPSTTNTSKDSSGTNSAADQNSTSAPPSQSSKPSTQLPSTPKSGSPEKKKTTSGSSHKTTSSHIGSGNPKTPTKVIKTTPKPTVNTTSKYLDGTYYGAGSDSIGTVYVAVTINHGKITNAHITRCDTHYPQSYIDPVLPREVIARQSANVDMISGATGSSSDFSAAVQVALEKAKNPHYVG